jgi:hypothetical protein
MAQRQGLMDCVDLITGLSNHAVDSSLFLAPRARPLRRRDPPKHCATVQSHMISAFDQEEIVRLVILVVSVQMVDVEAFGQPLL